MKLIKSSYKILTNINKEEIFKNIEIAGRICYKSENKITSSSSISFIKKLISNKHESVLEHEKITVLFICDRGISHELVRHRIASFSQESTRYCNYSKDKFGNDLTFIEPFWLKSFTEHSRKEFKHILEECSKSYIRLLKLGWSPQQARAVLPNTLKTEIVVTANIREWRTIFIQRTSLAAHPQMRELMIPLLKELQIKLPALFEDINN